MGFRNIYFTSILALLLAANLEFSRSEDCADDPEPQEQGSGISEEDKNVILDTHNTLREKQASKKEKHQPFTACFMSELKWDDDLAKNAQNWANELAREDKWGHNKNSDRKTAKFSKVGQNLFRNSKWPGTNTINYATAINKWYAEVELLTKNDGPGNYPDKKIGHYTQVVWATTTHVGCGAKVYQDGKWSRAVVVCDYGPAGNTVDISTGQKTPYQSEGCKEKCETYANKYLSLCNKQSN